LEPGGLESGKASGNPLFGRAVSIGTTLAVGMAVFVFIGYYIDSKRGTSPFWTICGTFAGLIYMGYEVWRESRLIMEESENEAVKKVGDDGKPEAGAGSR
jgi:F0F1-type ATP synthase assembly protein I